MMSLENEYVFLKICSGGKKGERNMIYDDFASGSKQSGLVRMIQPTDRYCHIVIYSQGSGSA